MKIKIISSLLLSLLFINPVLALTNQDVDFLIAGGFIAPDKIAAARAAASSSSSHSTTNTTTTPKHDYFAKSRPKTSDSCLKLNSDLFNGMSGAAVSGLQKFLKSQNHFSDDITGYFGNITQEAVSAFQKAQGIVLNGTPETTGLGKVGPSTRSAIEKISCATSAGTSDATTKDFFGYNLDELFNYDINLDFSNDFNYDSDFNYQSFSDYSSDFGYDVDDYEADFDYDSDIAYDVDDYDADFGYEAEFGSGDSKDATALLFVKAVNGEHLRGGNRVPVAVPSSNAELKWRSTNATTCSLSGDFKEKTLSVPVNGTANLVLTGASDVASNGDPMYAFKLYCFNNSGGYVFPGTDTALIWIAPASSTATTTRSQ